MVAFHYKRSTCGKGTNRDNMSAEMALLQSLKSRKFLNETRNMDMFSNAIHIKGKLLFQTIETKRNCNVMPISFRLVTRGKTERNNISLIVNRRTCSEYLAKWMAYMIFRDQFFLCKSLH